MFLAYDAVVIPEASLMNESISLAFEAKVRSKVNFEASYWLATGGLPHVLPIADLPFLIYEMEGKRNSRPPKSHLSSNDIYTPLYPYLTEAS